MDTIIYLILNLSLTLALVYICIWFFSYDMKWWMRVRRADNIFKNHFKKRVLLEIKVPREVTKSPAAMELFLGTITAQGLGHSVDKVWDKAMKDSTKDGKFLGWHKFMIEYRKYFFERYTKGSVRGWYSLEIVSEEGNIRFFIYTYDKHVDLHRNALYSQYPGIEVVEVEDYTLKHHYKPGGNMDLYVGRWNLKKPDYLPIKTYVDYGLDKDPKEEFKVDPLQSLLETMATAGKGEHFWLQIMLRATIDTHWKDESQARIDELLKVKVYTADDIEVKEGKRKVGDKEQRGSLINLSPKDKKEVEIISRNLEKDGLDCFIRFFGLKYKKPGEKFSMSTSKNILPIVYGLKPFDNVGYNSFGFQTITVDSDYPFLDPKGEWTNAARGMWWENYVLRSGFYFEAENFPKSFWVQWKIYRHRLKAVPTKEWANGFWGAVKEYWELHEIHSGGMGEFVLNTEEVATLFHIPSRINGTTSNVIGSVKSDPPLNLPV